MADEVKIFELQGRGEIVSKCLVNAAPGQALEGGAGRVEVPIVIKKVPARRLRSARLILGRVTCRR